jgi:hypothetical protein
MAQPYLAHFAAQGTAVRGTRPLAPASAVSPLVRHLAVGWHVIGLRPHVIGDELPLWRVDCCRAPASLIAFLSKQHRAAYCGPVLMTRPNRSMAMRSIKKFVTSLAWWRRGTVMQGETEMRTLLMGPCWLMLALACGAGCALEEPIPATSAVSSRLDPAVAVEVISIVQGEGRSVETVDSLGGMCCVTCGESKACGKVVELPCGYCCSNC